MKTMKYSIKKQAKKILAESSPVKIVRWKTSAWKNTAHHLSLIKCKLNQQWDPTIQLLEWPKSKVLTIPNIGKEEEPQMLSFIAGGNAKW
jgi:hypothetical protein